MTIVISKKTISLFIMEISWYSFLICACLNDGTTFLTQLYRFTNMSSMLELLPNFVNRHPVFSSDISEIKRYFSDEKHTAVYISLILT